LGLTNTELASLPADRLNNNYKFDSVEDCDIRKCDKEAEGGHYDLNLLKVEEKSIYSMPTKPDHPSATTSNVRCENFERMHVNKLLSLATSLPQNNIDFSEVEPSSEKHALISHIIDHAGDRIFNVDFLLGNCVSMGEAFLEPGSAGPLPTSQTFTCLSTKNTKAIESTKATLLAEASSSRPGGVKAGHLRATSSTKSRTASTSLTSDGRVKVVVFSSKIGDLKPLLLCEKLNSSALHLHLTAQSQTEVKKSRNSSFEADFATGGGRVKRQRRE
jgi:hypothetical protein